MSEYSASHLAKLFNVSRTTIYNYFNKELANFVKDDGQSKKLTLEGFNHLQLLLSESKVDKYVDKNVTDKIDNGLQANEQLIAVLKEQVSYLKGQLEKAQEALVQEREHSSTLLNMLNNRDQILLQSTSQPAEKNLDSSEQIKQEKVSFWKRLFTSN